MENYNASPVNSNIKNSNFTRILFVILDNTFMVFKEIKFKVFLMFLVGRLLYMPTYIGVQVCKYKRENYKNCYMRISMSKNIKLYILCT